MDAARTLRYYTMDDIYNLPDGQRAELIDGELYMMSAPGRIHQKIVKDLTYFVEDHIRRKKGECEVYPAPFAVFLNADTEIYLEPDISVICDLTKLDEKGCHGAPDWIIEIVSLGSRPMDYFTKLFKYRTAGVREYWIVDPAKELIMVYRFEKETMEQYSFGEEVPAGIYEGFTIKIE